MKSNTYLKLAATAWFCASLLSAGPGHAAHSRADVTATTSVPLADLDLASAAGVEALYDRLQRAARKVCGPQNLREAGSLAALKTNKHCVVTSLERVIADLGLEALGERHGA